MHIHICTYSLFWICVRIRFRVWAKLSNQVAHAQWFRWAIRGSEYLWIGWCIRSAVDNGRLGMGHFTRNWQTFVGSAFMRHL